jgi:hypothetical protein
MTDRHRVVAVVALVLMPALLATNTAGQRRNASFHVLGAGGGSCRDLTINLRADRESWGNFYNSYVMGFITGANFSSYLADARNSSVGFDVPNDRIFQAVEQFCGEYPAKGIHEAAETVYSQLAGRL